MKKSKILRLALSVSALFLFACEKDADVKKPIYRLTESSYNGESPTYYSYDSQGNLIKSYAYAQDSMEVSSHYSYTDAGELLSIKSFQGTAQNYEVNFTRKGNVVSHTSKRADMDGGNLLDEADRIDLYLNSNQQIERYVHVYLSETNVWDTASLIEYTWLAGNRVKSESFKKTATKKGQYLSAMIQELYFTKKTPSFKNGNLASSSISTSEFDTQNNYKKAFGPANSTGEISVNNLTKYKSIDSETGEVRYEGEYSYEYNDMNYPTKSVDNYNWFGEDMTDEHIYKYDYIDIE